MTLAEKFKIGIKEKEGLLNKLDKIWYKKSIKISFSEVVMSEEFYGACLFCLFSDDSKLIVDSGNNCYTYFPSENIQFSRIDYKTNKDDVENLINESEDSIILINLLEQIKNEIDPFDRNISLEENLCFASNTSHSEMYVFTLRCIIKYLT